MGNAGTGRGAHEGLGHRPEYKGLYACASGARELAAEVIDGVPADFPSVWKPSGYVKGMLEVDEAFEHLKAIESAGWTTPRDHPDLVPAAEAGRLADLYRVLGESDYARRKPPEFARMMRESNLRTQALEDMLAAGEQDAARLSDQFRLVAASCRDCHAQHRD